MAATDDTRSQRFHHGRRADLKRDGVIEPGRPVDVGERDRMTTYVYLTRTLGAATWGAELAVGGGLGGVHPVEPTGQIEEDAELTDQESPGDPTTSYRSLDPLGVTGEVTDRQGHSPGARGHRDEGDAGTAIAGKGLTAMGQPQGSRRGRMG